MRTKLIPLVATLLLTSCSPRDFLTRRLAFDLISTSSTFNAPQPFTLQTGVISDKDYLASASLVLQRHGWISASNVPCPSGLAPPPCWDLQLSPSGVETIRALVAPDETRSSFTIPVARRELISIDGVSSQGSLGDVDFTWRWVPLNEIGAALYSADPRYRSTVGFRKYDDGWRVLESTTPSGQTLPQALKASDP